MKKQAIVPTIEKKKVVSIMLLLITSIVITLLGASFSVFSVVNNISFTVLNSQIHGAIFGLIVSFLGLRYFFSVQKLKVDVYKTTSRFSWSNFRKGNEDKTFSNSR